ncbi:hypothetical protein Tco_0548041 [Tanacetum coccineum]
MVQLCPNITTLWVESQKHNKRRKKQKKQKKKVSSVKLGRNKDEGTLSEEHYVQDDYTAYPFFDDIVDKDAAVTPDLERKSDETEEINIEEKKVSDVKSGDTEELDLETFQSTARQSTITPRTLNFEDEADQEGLSIPGPIQSQSQPQQPSQATDPKDKGKGILDAEEERKRLEELKKAKPKTTLKKSTSLAQERNHMMNFLKGRGKATISEEKPSKKLKLRTETIDALRNYLRIVIDSPDGEYLIIHRANNHSGLLILYGRYCILKIGLDLYYTYIELSRTIMSLFLHRFRFDTSRSAYTRLEDGTMIHMLAERRYPLSRELMIRMLDHGMEVEDESEIAIAVIHLFILWTTEDCGGDEDFF